MNVKLLSPLAASMAIVACLAGCPGKTEGGAGAGGTTAGETPAASTAKPVDPSQVGTIKGTIKFDGAAPEAAPVDMSGTAECHSQHTTPVKSETLLVKDGKIQNVIVYLKDAKGTGTAPAEKALLDQKGCVYIPHVMVVQAGQAIDIKNSDPLLHNVHPTPKVNTEFNIGMPTQGQVVTKKFTKPEIVKFRCDVHAWMSSYVGVFDHPYAVVTGENGTFELKNVPAGEYTIEAWHEKLGTQSAKVKVDAKGEATTDFTFKAAS